MANEKLINLLTIFNVDESGRMQILERKHILERKSTKTYCYANTERRINRFGRRKAH